MTNKRRTWQEELEIIDSTMRAISGVTDPEELIGIYWKGIGDLITIEDYIALSRRNVQPPEYLITRSSRFAEDLNPWTQRELLPKYSTGLLGEIAYANKPVIIEDLPALLHKDDPAWFYLEGFQSLVALPQYDGGEGLNITLMLIRPGIELDFTMIPMMHWQAGLFGRGTTNQVLRNQLQTTMNALDRELQTVGNIQRSLLPQKLPSIAGFELAADYITSAQAGGDYYDFFPLADGAWGIFIADVAGHGTPAAVLMAITHALAHSQPGTHTPPDELLKYLNTQLARSYTRGGAFVTAFYAVLDPKSRTLTFARAGHNPPKLVRGKSVISLDENGALPLGIFPDQCYPQSSIQLEADDILVLYTDGITEAKAPMDIHGAHELFGEERLDQLLIACRPCSAQNCIDQIRKDVTAFCHNMPPTDDETLIVMRCM